VVAIKSVTPSFSYPMASTPTPFDCENCHWGADIPSDWPTLIKDSDENHHQGFFGRVSSECYYCHSIDPDDPSFDPDNQGLFRYCQKCHSKDVLHGIHMQGYDGWEAVGFHVGSQDCENDVVPTVQRSFTVNEMCVGCHGVVPEPSPVIGPLAPAMTDLTPSYGQGGTTNCSIFGTNFGLVGNRQVALTPRMGQTGQTHSIDSGDCLAWADNVISFTVPSGLSPGNYNLRVEGPNGTSNILVLTVTGTADCNPCPTSAPSIATMDRPAGMPSALITITGANFGDRRTGARKVEVQLDSDPLSPWVQFPIYAWSDALIKWKVPAWVVPPDDYRVRVVTESGTSNEVVFTIEEHPTLESIDTASGPCDTAIVLAGNGFQDQQSTMYADGIHGVHITVDFVGPDATYSAINYSNWTDASLGVNMGDLFEDQIDPGTGARNYIQDDGSAGCSNEPTISSCAGMNSGFYGIMLRAIYFRDEDASGNLSCGDTVLQVETSTPAYFQLAGVPVPVIEKIKPLKGATNPREPGTILRIIGSGFGPDQGTSEVHIGPKTYGPDHRKIKDWSDNRIKVKLPKYKCAWFKGEDYRKRRIWVTIGGVDSNKRTTKVFKPDTCL
jgi:hypothetical protein